MINWNIESPTEQNVTNTLKQIAVILRKTMRREQIEFRTSEADLHSCLSDFTLQCAEKPDTEPAKLLNRVCTRFVRTYGLDYDMGREGATVDITGLDESDHPEVLTDEQLSEQVRDDAMRSALAELPKGLRGVAYHIAGCKGFGKRTLALGDGWMNQRFRSTAKEFGVPCETITKAVAELTTLCRRGFVNWERKLAEEYRAANVNRSEDDGNAGKVVYTDRQPVAAQACPEVWNSPEYGRLSVSHIVWGEHPKGGWVRV